MAFQAKLFLHADTPLVPRPNLQGFESDDWDERVGDLQYRDAGEFVVGHGVSAHAICQDIKTCFEVETTWIPSAYVEKVEASPAPGVELSMEALAGIQSAQEAQTQAGWAEGPVPRLDRQAGDSTGAEPSRSRARTDAEGPVRRQSHR